MSLNVVTKEIGTDLQNLLTEFENMQKTFQAQAQAKMKEAFKAVFEQYADLDLKLVWTQYTPYFNDGEECIFSVNDIYVTNLPTDELSDCRWGEYDGEREGVYVDYGDAKPDSEFFYISASKVGGTHWKTREDTTPVAMRNYDNRAFEALVCALNSSSMEDVMKSTFGDHVQVIASINGFDVDDYEHD